MKTWRKQKVAYQYGERNNSFESPVDFDIVLSTPRLNLDQILQSMKFLVGLMACATFLAFSSIAQQRTSHNNVQPTSGEDILRQMALKYASVESYKDTGEVSINLHGVRPTVTNNFNTYFVRPDKYRFEWNTTDSKEPRWNVIWSSAGSYYSLDPSGAREREYRSDRTIAKAASVSRGASQTIAALLTTGITGFRVSQLERVSVLRSETFDRKNCYVVRGFHPLGFEVELWISKDDLLLRKIRQINKDGSFQEEIRRNIVVDEPISPNTFEYKSRKVVVKTVA